MPIERCLLSLRYILAENLEFTFKTPLYPKDLVAESSHLTAGAVVLSSPVLDAILSSSSLEEGDVLNETGSELCS